MVDLACQRLDAGAKKALIGDGIRRSLSAVGCRHVGDQDVAVAKPDPYCGGLD
jgi:hypothetical protein